MTKEQRIKLKAAAIMAGGFVLLCLFFAALFWHGRTGRVMYILAVAYILWAVVKIVYQDITVWLTRKN